MKTKLIKSFLLALIAAMLPQLANAYDFMVDEFAYNINEDGTSVSLIREGNPLNGAYTYYGDIVIPENVQFEDKTYIVTKIGANAFSWCGITSVTIPKTVTSIANRAFFKCSYKLNGYGLTTINIPSSVIEIGNNVFGGNRYIESITVENNNPKYDSREDCNAIIETETNMLKTGCKNTIIPYSVTSIGDEAFYECSYLTSVSIPNSVEYIGRDAFSNCTGLMSVNISDLNSWCNIYFNGEYSNPLSYAHSLYLNGCKVTKLVIPNSVTDIKLYSFHGCDLTSAIIPNSVKSIGYAAFYYCSGLASVTIPNSITSIGWGAFYGCTGLTSITLTGQGQWNNLNEIPSANTVNIGSGITYLGNFGFSPNMINCFAEIPPTCSSGTFSNYDGELHVPTTSIVSYFMADYWQNFNNMFNDLIEKVTLDKSNASLVQWETMALTATTVSEESDVIWSTSNPSVAIVDENGIVTATGDGECDIFASLASNLAVYAWCHITSSYPEITLSLSNESIEMNLAEEYTLTATITPENTGLTPTWASSNTSVATVDENGKVTAIGEGECDITAKVLDQTATCHVTVSGNVTLSLNIDNAIMGASQMLTVYPSCAPDIPVELVVTSSDQSVALARVVNRTNAPALGLKSFPEKDMALNYFEELVVPSESKDPALASTKAIMIVGAQNGTATITVTTADGKATPAVLELRVVDVDGDRTITATDITCLYNYLLNGDETFINTSDTNGDGFITSTDITVLYNLMLGN